MEDFFGCVLAMAGFTYVMVLVSLMVILITQDVNYVTVSVLVVLFIASIIMFVISYKYSKEQNNV